MRALRNTAVSCGFHPYGAGQIPITQRSYTSTRPQPFTCRCPRGYSRRNFAIVSPTRRPFTVRQRFPVTTIVSMNVRGSVQNLFGGVVPRLVSRTRKPGVRHTAIENHARFVQSSAGPNTFVSPRSVGSRVTLKSPKRCTFGVALSTNGARTTANKRTEIHLDTGVGD